MGYQFPCKCAQFSCGRGSSSSRPNMLLRAVLISWLAVRLHLQCTARLHNQSLARLSRHGDGFKRRAVNNSWQGNVVFSAVQSLFLLSTAISLSIGHPPSFYPSSHPGNGLELIPKRRPHPAASTLPATTVGQNDSHYLSVSVCRRVLDLAFGMGQSV